jgi:hypothetical protein
MLLKFHIGQLWLLAVSPILPNLLTPLTDLLTVLLTAVSRLQLVALDTL